MSARRGPPIFCRNLFISALVVASSLLVEPRPRQRIRAPMGKHADTIRARVKRILAEIGQSLIAAWRPSEEEGPAPIDPIVAALLADAALSRTLDGLEAARSQEARSWVDVDRSARTVRIGYRGPAEHLTGAMDRIRAAIRQAGERAGYGDVMYAPKWQGSQAILKLSPSGS